MRRFAVLLLLCALAVSVFPGVASADLPVPEDRISLFGGDQTFEAGKPFYVMHGWGIGEEPSLLAEVDFQLFIDGEERHGPKQVRWVPVDDPELPDVDRVMKVDYYFIFREGLPAGTYVFTGIWSYPGDPSWPYELSITVTFE